MSYIHATMPASTKKDLYLGKNIGDLNKLAGDIPKCENARIFVKSADKLFRTAEECNDQGDEEKAYLFFMKFFNVISIIKKTPDYKKNQKFFQDLIGNKNCVRAIEEAEILAGSLKERYEEREAKNLSMRLESLNIAADKKEKEEQLKKNQKKEENKYKRNKLDSLENTDQNDREDNEIEENTNGEENGDIQPKETRKSLSVYELYELLSNNVSLLIMDMRPKEQYEESHIKCQTCINVPASVVPPGSLVEHIEKNLPPESLTLWSQRSNVDYIILLDWSSSLSSLQPGESINSLKDAIYKWDRDTSLQREPLVLDRGYDAWLMHYPVLTTNANICRPSSYNIAMSNMPSLDTIDYDLDLGFLKPEEVTEKSENTSIPSASNSNPPFHQNNIADSKNVNAKVPTVNRANKPRLSNQTVNEFMSDSLSNKSMNVDKVKNEISVNGVEGIKGKAKQDYNSVVSKDTNIKTEVNQEIPKPNRALKPGSTDKSSKNARALLQEEWEQVHHQIQDKKSELRSFQLENARLISEHQARRARLEKDQQELDRLELLKKKEAKETAELMQQKKKIQNELINLQEEKKRRDKEENSRQMELNELKCEEEDKFRRLQEVDRMRAERKRKQLEKEASEREAKEREETEKILREKAEQERKIAEEKHKKEELERIQKENERIEKETQERKDTEASDKKKKEEIAVHAKKVAEEKERQIKELHEKQAKEERDKQVQCNEGLRKEGITIGQKLPTGWEKKLDNTTGRYIYIDHKTNQHYSQPPPPSPAVSPKKATENPYRTKIKDGDSLHSGAGLKRCHSSPNVAQMVDDEAPVSPSINRHSKPKPQQVVMRTEVSAAKVRNLQPTWGNVGHGLTGLRNMGNTCYMNSTIQCLSHTTFLTTYFLSDNYRSDINRDNFLGTGGNLAEEFAALIKALWSGQYRSVTPRDFKYTISEHNPMFCGYEQQDSQELLLSLMDGLHEDLNKVKRRIKVTEQDNDVLPDGTAAEKAWNIHKKNNNSIIVNLFQGLFKSTLTCMVCKKSSVTFDAFMYLSLPVPSSSRCSLKDCLMHFAKDEKMVGESQWKCPRCKAKRDAIKRMEIWKLPPILLIHLKRFYYQGMWRQKISAYVDFPLDGLDLRNYIAGPNIQKPYNLYGVSNHYGTMEGGHYTAYCKGARNQKWYKFDDHEVYEISKSDIKSSAAYILFYTSIDKDLQFQ